MQWLSGPRSFHDARCQQDMTRLLCGQECSLRPSARPGSFSVFSCPGECRRIATRCSPPRATFRRVVRPERSQERNDKRRTAFYAERRGSHDEIKSSLCARRSSVSCGLEDRVHGAAELADYRLRLGSRIRSGF
jgi:hypothetical protein